jgi:hypothetical protein
MILHHHEYESDLRIRQHEDNCTMAEKTKLSWPVWSKLRTEQMLDKKSVSYDRLGPVSDLLRSLRHVSY